MIQIRAHSVVLVVALLLPAVAVADVGEDMSGWRTTVSAIARNALSNPQLFRAADAVYAVLGAWLLLPIGVRAYNSGFRNAFPDLIEAVLLLLIVRVLMLSYDMWTSIAYNGVADIGAMIQMGLIGTPEPWGPPLRVLDIISQISFSADISIWNIFQNIMLAMALIIVSLLMFFLVVLSLLFSMWGFLGFTLLKLVGLLFIPLLLSDRFSGYFDNWLSMLLGFGVYDMLVRTVVSLCAATITLPAGVPPGASGGNLIIVESPWDALPLALFAVLTIFALWHASKMANALMSAGGALSANIRGLSKVLS